MVTSTRIFSFGLGHSPSRSLIKGLAHATNGRFVFIPPATNVDVYVGEQLQKALQPCFFNVHIKLNLDSTLIDIVPRSVPSVFINDHLIVYVLLKDDKLMSFNHDLSIELYSEEGRLCEAKINRIPSVSDDGMIARIAAKALILELQHSKLPASTKKDLIHSQQIQLKEHDQQPMVTTTEQRDMTKEQIQERIVETSLKHHILSPYTAFVGIEKRINASNADMILREVPIQISADNAYLKYLQTIISQMRQDQARAQMEYASMAKRSQFDIFDKGRQPLQSLLNNYINVQSRFDRTSMDNDETRQRFDRTLTDYKEALHRLDVNRCNYEEALARSHCAINDFEEAQNHFDRIDMDHRKAHEHFEHIAANYADARQHFDRTCKDYLKTEEHFDHTRMEYDAARKHFQPIPMDDGEARQQLDQTKMICEEARK
ncbi:unnamed protein product [Rotaria sp. Silwood1]|nr:unnamed protein product [Rotaria sp. Silwood1]